MRAEPVVLFDLPHRQARTLAATGAPVFLTVDPVEYHGPHLSLHNDRIMSAAVVRALHAGLAERSPGLPLVLADALPTGVDPVQGPGSRSVPFGIVRELVGIACRALADLGARQVVIVTSHGAPLHSIAIHHGVRELVARGVRAVAPFNVVLRDLIDPPADLVEEVVATVADDERAGLRSSILHDYHAGFFETSLTLHWAPPAVDGVYRDLPDVALGPPDGRLLGAARAARALGRASLAHELEFAAQAVAWTKLRPFPGYTGRPRLANAHAGAILARYAERRMLEVTRRATVDGEPPLEPPMQWLERASLGGRVTGFSVPLDAVRSSP